ncbi:hypothetical protein Trydic_g17212 [Trypoxylus dichotomus]
MMLSAKTRRKSVVGTRKASVQTEGKLKKNHGNSAPSRFMDRGETMNKINDTVVAGYRVKLRNTLEMVSKRHPELFTRTGTIRHNKAFSAVGAAFTYCGTKRESNDIFTTVFGHVSAQSKSSCGNM